MDIKIKRKYLVILVLMLIGGVITTTFAFFGINVIGLPISNSGVSSGTIELDIDDAVLTSDQLMPIYDTNYNVDGLLKTFTLSNTGTINMCTSVDLEFTTLPNELKSEYIKYSLELNDGTVIKTGNFLDASVENGLSIAKGIFIESEETLTLNLYIWLSYNSSINQNDILGKSFVGKVTGVGIDSKNSEECQSTVPTPWYELCTPLSTDLKCKMLAKATTDNVLKSDEDVVYENPADTIIESGLYYTTRTNLTEQNKRVYYYRGIVEDNYLLFADFCWRIVRTVEDGSIRLRYAGEPIVEGDVTTCPQTGTTVNALGSTIKYNQTYGDNAYVGYMMGLSNECDNTTTCQGTMHSTSIDGSNSTIGAHVNTYSSNIKLQIDSWYATNIANKSPSVISLIEDTPYCNDRSLSNQSTISSYANMTNEGYGTFRSVYGPSSRLISSSTSASKTGAEPTYLCARGNIDKFTINASKGNGDLTYPVGLLTADEIAYAGGTLELNESYYLNIGAYYWTMSPFIFSGSYSSNFSIRNDGEFSNEYVHDLASVLPAISLDGTATVTEGSGAYNNPYVIN